MANTKLFGLDDSRHTAPSGAAEPKQGLVLASASFDADGDKARDEKVRAAIEKAGYELPPPELPPPDTSRASTQAEARAQLERNFQRYGREVERAKEKYPDWQQVVGSADVHIGQESQVALAETPNATDVVYYLATHRETAERLGRMTPVGMIGEVRRLSAMLAEPGRAASTSRRPSQSTIDSMTFSELAAMPNYRGKARDLKRCREY